MKRLLCFAPTARVLGAHIPLAGVHGPAAAGAQVRAPRGVRDPIQGHGAARLNSTTHTQGLTSQLPAPLMFSHSAWYAWIGHE